MVIAVKPNAHWIHYYTAVLRWIQHHSLDVDDSKMNVVEGMISLTMQAVLCVAEHTGGSAGRSLFPHASVSETSEQADSHEIHP